MGRRIAPAMPCKPQRLRRVLLWAACGFALAAAIDPLWAQDAGQLPSMTTLSIQKMFAVAVVGLLVATFCIPSVLHLIRRALRGRREFQQEIDEGRKQLDRAISHMSQGLVMFDAAQRIVVCNARYI